jgi:acetyl-CoA synthetase
MMSVPTDNVAVTRVLEKHIAPGELPPNLADYDAACAEFSWEAARAELSGHPSGTGLNIAYEAVARHAAGPRARNVALRCLSRSGARREITYAELARLTNRFANVLRSLGASKGDRVFVLADRIPELYVAALGTLANGSVFCPLFSAFGPEPIRMRMTLGRAAVLVTTHALYERKVASIRSAVPTLGHVLVVGNDDSSPPKGTQDLRALMERAAESFTIPPTADEDLALLHFTSGTTGTPKGAMHVHGAVIAHHITGKLALDLKPADVFWCTADPGGSPAPLMAS